MTKRIAIGMVSHITDDPGRHITIPGADDCCERFAKLSMDEGGNCRGTIYGMLRTLIEITGNPMDGLLLGDDGDYELFETLVPGFSGGRVFYIQSSYMFKELSDVSNYQQNKFVDIVQDYNKQIYLLGNDLLYPAGESMSDKIGGQAYFQNLLCIAPCEGPCHKPLEYDSLESRLGRFFPDFECPNTPNWLGERWDGFHGSSVDRLGDGFGHVAKQGNGLDYMALFNMYSLMYAPNAPYYAPTEGLEASIGKRSVSGSISGADIVCPITTRNYLLSTSYTNATLSQVTWDASSNITLGNQVSLVSPNRSSIEATISAVLIPSFVEAHFVETRPRDQYYSIDGAPVTPEIGPVPFGIRTISDECQMYYRKPILTEIPEYTINTDWLFCPRTERYTLGADGTHIPGASFYWEIEDYTTNPHVIRTCTTQYCTFTLSDPHPSAGYGEIRLTVTVPECGSKLIKKGIAHAPCQYITGATLQGLDVFPNPGRDLVNIVLTDETYEMPLSGIPVRIAHTETGVIVHSERIYSRSAQVNIAQIPVGAYEIQVQTEFVSLNKPLMIVRD